MVMDCKSWEHKMIPKGESMPYFQVIVVYSGITKNLIGTDFNNRVDEVRVAGWLLQELEGLPITKLDDVKLRDIPRDVYEGHKDKLLARFSKRAAHYYTEQERVQLDADAWAKGDIETFGQLMFESGHSSFYQQEFGIPEMETIYNTLRETEGVFDARPSGTGYRCAVVGLVNPEYKYAIKARINEVYPVAHPQYKEVFEINFWKTDDGARYVDPNEFE